MASVMYMALARVQSEISKDRGEIRGSAAIGGLILLVAYLAFPQAFIGFFHWIMHHVFSALHDSFGNHNQGAGHHATNHVHGAGPTTGTGSGATGTGGEAKSAIGPGRAARGAK